METRSRRRPSVVPRFSICVLPCMCARISNLASICHDTKWNLWFGGGGGIQSRTDDDDDDECIMQNLWDAFFHPGCTHTVRSDVRHGAESCVKRTGGSSHPTTPEIRRARFQNESLIVSPFFRDQIDPNENRNSQDAYTAHTDYPPRPV